MKKWPGQNVPVLETARLTLRAHLPEDFEACARLWADAEVTRYITGKALTGEEVWSRMLRYAGHWDWLRFGYWALEEKSSGLFIGEAGFADYKREIEPSLAGTPELGYVLSSNAHGKGYATEAVRAIVEWGDHGFDNARTVCIVSPENLPSLRVAEKCGFKEYRTGRYHGKETLILQRIRPQRFG